MLGRPQLHQPRVLSQCDHVLPKSCMLAPGFGKLTSLGLPHGLAPRLRMAGLGHHLHGLDSYIPLSLRRQASAALSEVERYSAYACGT